MENINIDTVLRTNPFLALDIPNIEEIALKYLPYSIGFEIECDKSSIYNKEEFTSIEDIMDVNNSDCEQRYRIPPGIKGLLCLYTICDKLKTNSILNDGSGIHYHVDYSDELLNKDGIKTIYFDFIKNNNEFLRENTDFLLQELDKWDYKGTYNRRTIETSGGVWIKLNEEFKTLEFRIGEMSFDYEVLVKRILHVSLLSYLLKAKASIFDTGIYINYIEKEENIKRIIEERIIDIYETKSTIITENISESIEEELGF